MAPNFTTHTAASLLDKSPGSYIATLTGDTTRLALPAPCTCAVRYVLSQGVACVAAIPSSDRAFRRLEIKAVISETCSDLGATHPAPTKKKQKVVIAVVYMVYHVSFPLPLSHDA